MQERLLYRLSVSKYSGRFVLKGGLLLYGIHRLAIRPTVDIDFLARSLTPDEDMLARIFRDVVSSVVEEDGVTFFPDSVRTQPLTAQTKYGGIRVEVDARLEQVRKILQIDIGFGDVVVPNAKEVELPTLLGSPGAPLLVYSLESVIAEKFDAMVRHSYANSRMKDFYDIQMLSHKQRFDGRILQEETFNRRGTPVERNIAVLRTEFGRMQTYKLSG